jgi:MoaA/NifB/PqqE/SkfB family radical SAM enzyme
LNRIVFELTNRCNLSCKHCLREATDEGRDLPIELVERIFGQAKDAYRINTADFTGGEPLLYPHLERLLDLLVEFDFNFSLVTNGHLMPQRIDLFKHPEVRGRIEHVAVSIEGPDAETHDSIRGEGSYKKAMQAIVGLKSLSVPVVVKYTIGAHNIHSLEEAALSLSHLEVKRIEFALAVPTPDNVAAGLIPDPAQYRRAEAVISRLTREMKTTIAMNAGTYVKQSFFTCSSLAMLDLYVDAKGRLCLCCMLPRIRGRDSEEREVVADLAKEDLWNAQKKMINLISGFQRSRINRIGKGELGETDHFQCLACMRYFGKTKWLDKLPDNPWSRSYSKKEP